MTTASILVLGRDMPLLDTRAWVLRQAGYRVKALAPWEVIPETESVDLLILCHTITEDERDALLLMATAQRPAIRMLCLTPTAGSLQGIPNIFNSFDGPSKLIETVQKLLMNQ